MQSIYPVAKIVVCQFPLPSQNVASVVYGKRLAKLRRALTSKLHEDSFAPENPVWSEAYEHKSECEGCRGHVCGAVACEDVPVDPTPACKGFACGAQTRCMNEEQRLFNERGDRIRHDSVRSEDKPGPREPTTDLRLVEASNVNQPVAGCKAEQRATRCKKYI